MREVFRPDGRLIGQLRYTEIVGLAHIRTLVDAGVQINIMPARLASRRKIDCYISLAIETASIAHVGIVINQGVNVGCLSPAHPFEMDSYGGARGTRSRRDGKGGRSDSKSVSASLSLPLVTSIR